MDGMRERCEMILAGARSKNVLLRVIGGMAVYLHSPQAASQPALVRSYGDLDFVTASPDDQGMRIFFESIGFTPNARFNALQGKTRMLFNSPDNSWHIDIFINRFRMCHTIEFPRARLLTDPLTIPLAELLLTKLQIVQINPKDIKDIAALLLEHQLGLGDNETINMERILEITSQDWGLFTTVSMNLEKIPGLMPGMEIAESDRLAIQAKLLAMGDSMQKAPKSLTWKLRAVMGKAVPWYEEPEDAEREAILKLG